MNINKAAKGFYLSLIIINSILFYDAIKSYSGTEELIAGVIPFFSLLLCGTIYGMLDK